MKEQLLPMVTVEFKEWQNFRCLLSYWKEIGGYKGFVKMYSVPFKEIKEVRTEVLKASEYPEQEWDGA